MEGVSNLMKAYFILEESMSNPGSVIIKPNFNEFTGCSLENGGSFSILGARVMNLSYAQYLRMCRDIFHGEIQGKNTMYPQVYFKTTEARLAARILLKTLNTQMNNIMHAKSLPHTTDELIKLIDELENKKITK